MKLMQLKDVAYSDRIRRAPEYLALAQQATAYLDQLLRDSAPRVPGKWSAPRVSAEWDSIDEGGGRSIILLRIWDHDGEGRARFTPDELKTPAIRDHRLWRVYDDLLRQGIDKHLQGVLEDGGDAGL